MKKTYISISITYYSHKYTAPEVHYYRNDGDRTVSTLNKLTVNEANQLMWELVKLGGENSYRSNRFKNSISERVVTFWGQL